LQSRSAHGCGTSCACRREERHPPPAPGEKSHYIVAVVVPYHIGDYPCYLF
jgi:hypothetical protein